MFNTTFSFNSDFNQYELKVDHSKHDSTIAWLKKFSVRFNLTSFSRYILIEILQASDAVIDALYSKFLSTELAELIPVVKSELELAQDNLAYISKYRSFDSNAYQAAEWEVRRLARLAIKPELQAV